MLFEKSTTKTKASAVVASPRLYFFEIGAPTVARNGPKTAFSIMGRIVFDTKTKPLFPTRNSTTLKQSV